MSTHSTETEIDVFGMSPDGWWSKSKGGYEWITEGVPVDAVRRHTIYGQSFSDKRFFDYGNEGPWIVARKVGHIENSELYNPMVVVDKKNLAVQFLELAQHLGSEGAFKQAVLKFVSRNGLLGAEQVLINGDAGQLTGETLKMWKEEVFRLKHLHRVYLLLRDPSKRDELASLIDFDGLFPQFLLPDEMKGLVSAAWMGDLRIIMRAGLQFPPDRSRDPVAVGGFLLVWHFNAVIGKEVLVFADLVPHVPLRSRPKTLLGAIYLLYAVVHADMNTYMQREVRMCQSMGCPNKLPPDRSKYCSDKCMNTQTKRNTRARAKQKQAKNSVE